MERKYTQIMNLSNNHPEMKTVVETFVIEETATLIYDNEDLDKWNKHVEELGLVGQTSIQVKEKSPIPFMPLKRNLVEVFSTLCPRRVDVKDYNVTPIPLEILDLVALSIREKYFDEIEIWYDGASPDPACIGLIYPDNETRQKGYRWYMKPYLLGKWADVKHSFAELTELATKRYIQEESHRLKVQIRDTQRALDDLKQSAFTKFGSDINGLDTLLF